MNSQVKYSNKIAWIIILIHLSFVASGQSGSGPILGLPFSKYISSSEYNSGMLNSSITQDKRGFMYFANNFGLLEFDGNTWRTYPVRDGSKVRDVAISSTGKIYVGAGGDFGYFIPDSIGDLSYFSLSETLPEANRNLDDVWNVFIGKEYIYFCTSNKIFIYNNDDFVDVISIKPTYRFFFLNNRVYFQEESGGLYSLKSTTKEEILDPIQINSLNIVSILPLHDNRFFMTSSHSGFYDIMGHRLNTPMNSDNKLINTTIRCAVRLRNGNIALGTQDDGLFIYNENGKKILHMTKGSGLENRGVYTMFEDKHGNLWLGHNNGVTFIELSIPFTYLNEDSGLPGSGYDAYGTGDDMLLATNNGLFKGSLSDPDLQLFNIRNTNGQSYSINEFRGRVLLGHHSGSFEITEKNAIRLNDGTGTWTYLQSSINSETIIAGTYDGLQLLRFNNSAWNFVSDIKGFEESSRVMEYDEYGDIWMTHGYKGVYRLLLNEKQDSVKSVQYYGVDDGLPSHALTNVYMIEDELVFTTLEGPYIFNYDDNRFIPEPILSGYDVLNKPLNFMVNDDRLNIYFLTQQEVGMLKKQNDGSYVSEIDAFNKIIPYLNDDLQGISIINSNNVLFGAKEGFIVYHPLIINSITENTFNTFIRSVTLSASSDSLIFAGTFSDGTQIEFEQSKKSIPSIPFKFNSIHFTYCANFLNDFNQTMYQHILEGFEENWSSWQYQSETRYTNLKKGEYTLKVKAKNIYSLESTETKYSFTISAPWYMSKIAYIAYLSLFLTCFFLIFRYIDKRYRESKKDFELKKQGELDEISGKLNSLTEEKKEEIEKLKSEKLESEIEYKNAELASSTMNLLNKNIFISQIKSDITSVFKKSKSDEVKNELSKIKKEIDKNISYDDDWDQFTFHFNSVHGDFTKRLCSDFDNLSAQDLRLCSYLRLNLSTKEIAHLLNISVRGVEISRYRLRKKLNLDRKDNLAEFILNY